MHVESQKQTTKQQFDSFGKKWVETTFHKVIIFILIAPFFPKTFEMSKPHEIAAIC